jgi:large subunit ribosomal protein L7A
VLDTLKNYKKVIGLRQSSRVIENGTAAVVFVALDADEKLIDKIKQLCQKNNVNIEYIDSMKKLAKACGIDVETAVACKLKQ